MTKWETEFDFEFGRGLNGVSNFEHPEAYKWVKSFIEKTLSKQQEDTLAVIEGMKLRESTNDNKFYKKGELIDCGFNAGLDAVKAKLKAL